MLRTYSVVTANDMTIAELDLQMLVVSKCEVSGKRYGYTRILFCASHHAICTSQSRALTSQLKSNSIRPTFHLSTKVLHSTDHIE